jgi:hypothetical protein
MCLAVTLLVGCSSTVRVRRLKPAEAGISGRIRVAVKDFSGQDGTAFQGRLEQAIQSNGFHDLIDRSQLQSLLAEQSMSASALAREDGTVRMGDLLIAGAYVTGDAETRAVENTTSNRRQCSRFNPNTKKTDTYPCTDYTREGRANYVVNAKIIDVSTGKVLGTRNYRKERRASTSATDGQPRAINYDELVDGLRDEVVNEFMRVLAPYSVDEEVRLVTDGALPQLEEGNKFAALNQWSEAVQRYGAAVAAVSASSGMYKPESAARAFYSLGLGLVMIGEYDQGIGQLKRASSTVPSEEYVAMLARANQWKLESDKVKAQSDSASAGAPAP